MLKNLTKPCNACPFKRNSMPGYLGEDTAENFMATTMDDFEMPCHKTVDYSDPGWFENLDKAESCAGAAIFFANICKLSRDRDRMRLPADRKEVFASQGEFIKYHETRRRK